MGMNKVKVASVDVGAPVAGEVSGGLASGSDGSAVSPPLGSAGAGSDSAGGASGASGSDTLSVTVENIL